MEKYILKEDIVIKKGSIIPFHNEKLNNV